MEASQIKPLLATLGYKPYKQHFAWPYTHKLLWQKQVDSKVVCQLNDKLFVDILEYSFENEPCKYVISITAQKYNKWWDLQCYSLIEEDLHNELSVIEEKLVKIWEVL